MHELSIVRNLLQSVAQHAPAESIVRGVHIRVGPLQAIEPDAMQWAWQAATMGTSLRGAVLDLQILPWQLRCPKCRRQWEGQDPLELCSCGGDQVRPVGSDELTLVSLDVDDP